MFLSGSWEPSTFRLFRDLVPIGGNVVDVGAHVGQFTIAAATKVGPTGMVIGIEPNPSTCAMLLSNVQQSQQTKVVRVVSTPLSAGAEIIPFGIPPVWSTGLTRPRKDTTEDGFFVRGITPFDLLQYFGMHNVDVMKIDIEAHDLDVISSLFETSTIRPHHILFEYIPDHFSYHISREEISNYFANHGYKLLLVNGDPYLPTIRAIEDNLWASRTLQFDGTQRLAGGSG
jgi:FkbM family methyltransferase